MTARKKAKRDELVKDVPHAEAIPQGLAPGFVKLEEQVERMKRREEELGLNRQPVTTVAGFKHIGQEVLAYMRDRHGVTPEQIAAAHEELEQRHQQDIAELREGWREGKWRKLCPERFRAPFDFDKVPGDKWIEKDGKKILVPAVTRKSVDTVLNWRFGPKGLYLIGESGRAKTTTMFAMLRRIAIEENRSVIVMDGIQFSTACSAAFSEPTQTERWLKTLTTPDVLVIDDLAKRFTPATQQGFFAVMDRRTARMKPVIITTNCSGEMLEQMIDEKDRASLAEPMRRRLRQYCQVVLF